MPTREQVRTLARERGSYELAARELGVHPGQAYLVATGMPADGSGGYTEEELSRPGVIAESSTQHLIHLEIPVVGREAASDEVVHAWIKERVAGDGPMQAAARARDAAPDPAEEEAEGGGSRAGGRPTRRRAG